MKKPIITLSKSKILTGLQCVKALYLQIHQPELAVEVSSGQQALFDQGKEVGLAAQKQFLGGVTIDAPYYDSELAIQQTKEAIDSGANTIYEATFKSSDVVAKIDILHRNNPEGDWHIIEVKSSTGVKDVHYQDVAAQVFVANGSGLQIAKSYVMHLNNKCVWPDASNLFVMTEVTDQVSEIVNIISEETSKLKAMVNSSVAPEIDIGPYCNEPYECAFKSHCWKHIPSPSVFEIPRINEKAWEYYSAGIISLDHDGIDETGKRRKQIDAAVSGKRWVDAKGIKKELSKWEWPLHYLDFETINFAIPKYAGTRPYQQVPFQFSCHVQASLNSEVTHHEYLHLEPTDPRKLFVENLLRAVNDSGNIVAYNKAFESGCILRLADEFPEHAVSLKKIAARLVDPLPLFQNYVYDREFRGSFSLKAVAPAILGKGASYDGMEVADGGAAQCTFIKIIGMKPGDAEREQLASELRKYCKKDTKVMVELVAWLRDV